MHPLKMAGELLKYTLWADRRIVAAVSLVREEDASRSAGTSHGSLVGTLAHILGAEQMWFSRWVGDPLNEVPGIQEYADLAAVKNGFEEFWPQMEFFIASLSQELLQGDVDWNNSRGETHRRKLWQCILHLANHSSYHRGQVVTLLRQLGYEPPATDLIYFFED
ncbi:MAG: DinB family protein [Deltaproteobacteria bacterium]|nr:DinB family protein [Deltaproteobacteria bacterium]